LARQVLTINVEVRVEANPRPLNVISNQSSKSDVVFRFQRDMRPVPRRDSPVLARVKPRYFPVRRIILRCGLALFASNRGAYQPAPTLPMDKATFQALFSTVPHPRLEVLTEFGTRCSPASLALWRRTAMKYWITVRQLKRLVSTRLTNGTLYSTEKLTMEPKLAKKKLTLDKSWEQRLTNSSKKQQEESCSK
jgi:hypothetical protein